jgi:predicted dehydrogenase
MGQLAHIANFASLPGCRLVAVADRRRGLAEKVAARYGIERVYGDHRELAAADDIDAVAAILAHPANARVAKDLLAAGKHVLVEKPMAVSADQGRELVEASRAAGKHLVVGYMKRSDAGVEWARDAIRGWDGDTAPTLVRAHCFGGDWICGIEGPIGTDEPYPQLDIESDGPAWLSPEERQQYQTYANVWIHNINLVRYLLARELSVLSVTDHRGYSVVTMSAGDTLVSVESGGMSSQWWDEVTTVYFPDGYVDVKTPPPMLRNVPAQVERYRAKLERKDGPVAAWTWAFRNQADNFLKAVRGDMPPVSSAEDGLADLEVIERMFRVRRGEA